MTEEIQNNETIKILILGGGFGGVEQIDSKTKGAFNANESIKSEYNASSEFTADEKTGEKLRAGGFGTVLTFREDGLARGNPAAEPNQPLHLTAAASRFFEIQLLTSRRGW